MNIKFKFRTIINLAVLFLFVGFVGMQFIPSTRNRSNQVLDADFAKTFGVPNDVQALLERSCYDCHSDNTKYPWYHRLQPAAWFMERHISEGKEELNFSEFGSYSKRRQESKLKSIISQIMNEEMPLPSYTYLHWDASLSENEKLSLERYFEELRSGL